MPYLGDTFRIRNTLTDWDGKTPLEPDSHVITLLNPSKQADGTLGLVITISPGVYDVPVTTALDDPTGEWTLIWTAKKDTEEKTEVIPFEIEKRPETAA